ncbi:hypothetical protein L1887_61391 [Cichorium endivia]|nr:hypothetical protein L1887_61391 [Cichorium endivia]
MSSAATARSAMPRLRDVSTLGGLMMTGRVGEAEEPRMNRERQEAVEKVALSFVFPCVCVCGGQQLSSDAKGRCCPYGRLDPSNGGEVAVAKEVLRVCCSGYALAVLSLGVGVGFGVVGACVRGCVHASERKKKKGFRDNNTCLALARPNSRLLTLASSATLQTNTPLLSATPRNCLPAARRNSNFSALPTASGRAITCPRNHHNLRSNVLSACR